MSDTEDNSLEPLLEAAPADSGAALAPAQDGPRIRWAGVIWGLALAGVGLLALRMLLTPAARDAVYEWAVSLTPLSVVACMLLVVGALLLITGFVGLARRLQRVAASHRANGDV